MIFRFLSWLFRKGHHMAAVDFSEALAVAESINANIQKVADAVAANSPARVAQLEADLATAQADAAAKQADLDASQAAEADLAAKLKASNDALAALVPPAA